LANPSNLGEQSTDAGTVPNLKWRFSDSKTKIFNGGWVREQVIQDLPQSHDISAAQQHLKKGATRELHWHRVAEWGFVYSGRVLVSAVDENGKYQVDILGLGDIWYFPKGQAHTVHGLDDENEYLLVFDDGDFDKVGTTFNIDDWLSKTPKSILAKNFGVNESVFNSLPTTNPYILNGTISTHNVTGPNGQLIGNSSYVYHTFQHKPEPVPGGGGLFYKIDSTNFPIATTIASTFVQLEPKGLRELHWHPTVSASWTSFTAVENHFNTSLTTHRPRSGYISMRVKGELLSSLEMGMLARSTSPRAILQSFLTTVVSRFYKGFEAAMLMTEQDITSRTLQQQRT
jgi:oxalate decarboxylase